MNPYKDYFMQSFSVGGMHSLPPAVAPFFLGGVIVVLVWSFLWKGYALWFSARNRQKAWFIILLIVNTLGILEIIYILFFRKDKNDNTTKTIVHTTTTTTSTPTSPTAPAPTDSSGPVA